MLKIGNIQLDNPFVQAALSGYTDYPMRILAKRFGCALTLTGVMLDRISLHPKAIMQSKFHCRQDEHPVAAQIFGDDPHTVPKRRPNELNGLTISISLSLQNLE